MLSFWECVCVVVLTVVQLSYCYSGGAQIYAEHLHAQHLRDGPPAHLASPFFDDTGYVQFKLNMSSTCEFTHFFEGSVGSGHMSLTARADYREHLTMAARDLGVKRVRGHGLLDDDMSVSYSYGKHSFYNIDSFVDFLLSINMHPIFEV